jgi:Siphovirus ReqiPepy6 Gp37-like protein
MDLYTLDENFLRRDVVDDFSSVVWTERYSKSGDVELYVPWTAANVAKLPEGTFLSTPGSQEVMLLDTVLKQSSQLKLTGNTLIQFLNNRVIRTSSKHEDRYWNIAGTPGQLLNTIVQYMCISGPYLTGSTYLIDGPREIIPNLVNDAADLVGVSAPFAVPFGPVYDVLEQVAESYDMGISLYLASASVGTYSLHFKGYRGKDRTSKQTVNSIVRLSPAADSLANVSELRSLAGYKNVAYSFAPANPNGLAGASGVAYADSQSATSIGFKRRVMLDFAEDITTDNFSGSAATLLSMLNQRAKDALANNNYVKVVDGEVVPQSQFKFGKDYGMGDIIELQSLSGLLQSARITEYIRSQDSTGERAYPTITVLD